MDLFASIETCFTKYTDFSGRANRSEFWWFILFNVIIASIAISISYKLTVIVGFALILPFMTAQARRLHDINKSKYWVLGFWILNIIFLIMFFDLRCHKNTVSITRLAILVPSLFIVALGFLAKKSDPKANKYGDVPKA